MTTTPRPVPIVQKLVRGEATVTRGGTRDNASNLAPGFVEAIYHECLEIEFEMAGIPAVSKPRLEIQYKGRALKQRPEPDFVCFGKLILEIKAVKSLCDEHRSQLHNYLRATGFELGLLVNFCGKEELEWERILKTEDPKKYAASFDPPRLQT